MASNSTQPQDLASILQILSSFAPQTSISGSCNNAESHFRDVATHASGHRADPATRFGSGVQKLDDNNDDDDEQRAYEPTDSSMFQSKLNGVHSSIVRPGIQVLPQLPDARSIIDWPSGLRYITQLAARDETLGILVKKLIENQRRNEENWWTGREILLQKQRDRVREKEKLDGVLRSIGGAVTNSERPDPTTELLHYDKKVHRAQGAMVQAMEVELAGLGVPFFGTSDVLVMDDKMASDTSSKTSTDIRRISKFKLLQLQKQMLRYLEDMYGQ